MAACFLIGTEQNAHRTLAGAMCSRQLAQSAARQHRDRATGSGPCQRAAGQQDDQPRRTGAVCCVRPVH